VEKERQGGALSWPIHDEAPVLQTRRLWLTAFDPEDARSVYRYSSNPTVSRYTTWEPSQDLAEVADFIEHARAERYCWAIRLASDGPAVGAIECSEESEEEDGCASIHYVLSEEHWGRGLMTEAVTAVVSWAFEADTDLRRVQTNVVEANAASRRVLEKCGMELAGFILEEWEKFDEPVRSAVYGMEREAWRLHSS